jgi:hypothetical protein
MESGIMLSNRVKRKCYLRTGKLFFNQKKLIKIFTSILFINH